MHPGVNLAPVSAGVIPTGASKLQTGQKRRGNEAGVRSRRTVFARASFNMNVL